MTDRSRVGIVAPQSGAERPPPRALLNLFSAMMVYYWALMVLSYTWMEGLESRVDPAWHAAMLIPVVIYLAYLGYALLLAPGLDAIAGRILVCGLLLAAFVVSTSVVKGNLAAIPGNLLFIAAFTVILAARPRINVALLNALYLATIALAVVNEVMGRGEYGLLVDVPALLGGATRDWRVSILPGAVFGSAVFSLLVLVANAQRSGKSPFSWAMAGLALYFVIFSGSRSVLICLAVFGFVYSTAVLGPRRRQTALGIFMPLTLLVPVIPMIVLLSAGLVSGGGYVDRYFFRGEYDTASLENYDRMVIWGGHLQNWSSSPITGGTRSARIIESEKYGDAGSESFLTGFLAEHGMGVLLLMYIFWLATKRALGERHWPAYYALCTASILSVSYSSFFVPYNLLFLLLLAMSAAPPGGARVLARR